MSFLRALSVVVCLVACADDEDPRETPPADIGTDGVVADTMTPETMTPDAMTPDTAVVDASLSSSSFRVANLRSETFVVCHKKKGDTAYIGPLYQAQGGLKPGEVSAWIPIENADHDVVYVAPGGDCTAMFVSSSSITLSSFVGSSRLSLAVRGSSSLGSNGAVSTAADKDSVYYLPDGQNGSFAPDDGSPSVTLGLKGATSLPANVVGKILLAPAGTARAFKTKPGGAVTVFGRGNDMVICDDLAPAVGHLSDCRATVRAP